MRGRSYVLPDDIQALLYPVLAHRHPGDLPACAARVRPHVLAEVTAQTPVPVEESWSVEEPPQQITGQLSGQLSGPEGKRT